MTRSRTIARILALLRVANARPAWIVDAPESGALAVM